MNSKLKDFAIKFSYAITSNLVSFLISIIVIIVVPKLVGVEEYGYWQLYMFYSTYIGFLHLGWNDGIYLRYGGHSYENLDKRTFFPQFIMLASIQVIFSLSVYVLSACFTDDGNRFYIFKMIAVAIFLFNTRSMCLFIVQATNRIKEYSFITIGDRIVYIAFICIALLAGFKDFKTLILADIAGKIVSLLIAVHCCKDIIFNNIKEFRLTLEEALENISAGMKLMLANVASLLIIGVIRFGIERAWSVATFGKVSLIISVSNMMMLFINTVGILVYPLLRRAQESRLAKIYMVMRTILVVLLLGMLLVYYPVKSLLSLWLPAYADSFEYLAILFPILLYEGKMSLLLNTYLKTLRKEKMMLAINAASLMISIFLALLTTQLLHSLELSVLSILIALMIRSVIAEIYLSKILNIRLTKDLLYETGLTVIFTASAWFAAGLYSALIYLSVYVCYVYVFRTKIKESAKLLSDFMRYGKDF